MLSLLRDGQMTDEINFWTKRHEYGFMSNFYVAHQVVDGKDYQTNEHWYQSQKYIDGSKEGEWTAEQVRKQPTASHAYWAGRRTEGMRPDWEQVKVEVMLKGLRAKFQQNKDLADKLLATGDAVIHEDSPHDMFWGKKGQDMLGKLLMQVREELG